MVTGAFGFIGSNMIKFLLNNTDYHITGVDDSSGCSAENMNLIIELQKENVDRISLQFFGYEKCNVNDIDIVYHFGATPRVSYSVEEPLKTNNNNVTKTLELLDRCSKAGVKRFVFSSSSSVYGNVDEFPTKEDYIRTPLSPYALQKAVIEDYCRLWSELYGMETVCLRYFNVYGPNQYAENAYATVICAWIKSYILNEPIRLDGTGEQSRDFTYVSDICKANYIAGDAEGKFSGDIFNAAGGNNYSLNDVKRIIESISENRVETINKPPRAGDVLKTHSNSNKLGELGFNCEVDLEDGIKKTYNWYYNLLNLKK